MSEEQPTDHIEHIHFVINEEGTPEARPVELRHLVDNEGAVELHQVVNNEGVQQEEAAMVMEVANGMQPADEVMNMSAEERPVATSTEEKITNEQTRSEAKRKRVSDKKKNRKKAKLSVEGEDVDSVHIEELEIREDESDEEYDCCQYKGYIMGVGPKEFKKRVTTAVEEWVQALDPNIDQVEYVPCSEEGCNDVVLYTELPVHVESHVKDSDTFHCPEKECVFESPTWIEMKGHVIKHRGKFMFGSWKCNQEGCTQFFTRKLHLKRHVMFKHFYENIARMLASEYTPLGDQRIKKLQLQAPQTLKKFKKRLKGKKDRKSQKKFLRCVKCNAVFKTMPDVDEHMAKHIVRIKCTECEGYFDDEAQLKTHVKENHSRMLHTNRCQLCSYSCLNSADLKTHMYSHENTVFECDLCGRICANPKTLKSHRMRKHPDLFHNKNLICVYCNTMFSNDVLLQDHIRNKHKMRLNGQRRINRREELKFPCNHCGFVANRQSSLEYHMRVHLENRPYKCTHCSYASKTRNNLILHIRTHKALAPLECPHCEFRGATNKVIQQHITSKHTNERPFKCTVCPWSTCYSGNLWKHMRMHKEKDGIEIPESTRKRNPRTRKSSITKSNAPTMVNTLPVTIYDGQIQVQQQQQHHQQQQIHIHHQPQGQQVIQGGHQEVIQMQPRVQVQAQHQGAENSLPQFAQVVLAEAPPHHQTVEIQIHGGEGSSTMMIPRHGDDDMAAETVQQLVNLANMLPASSTGHVMHTMQPAHAQ